MQTDPYIKRTPVVHMIAVPNWLRRIDAVFNVSAAMTSHGVGGKHLPMKFLMSRVVSSCQSADMPHVSDLCVCHPHHGT